jgi:hypothetical protein
VCDLQLMQGESEGRGAERNARLTLGYRKDQLEGEILHSIVESQRYLRVAFEPGPSCPMALRESCQTRSRVAALTLVSKFNGRRAA